MVPATQIQILDEAVGISQRTNSGLFNLDMATGLREKIQIRYMLLKN